MNNEWAITFTSKAEKQAKKLPLREQEKLQFLLKDLRVCGPVVPHWRNYSKLAGGYYHCHLSYRWVAFWELKDNELKIIEVYYLGSRENAPYG